MFENWCEIVVLCCCYEDGFEVILIVGEVEGSMIVFDCCLIVMVLIVMLIGVINWYCEGGWLDCDYVIVIYCDLVFGVVGV